MITCKNVSFRYPNCDNDALKGVNLSIGTGECVVLCGKSGCGKTTFLRLLNGLIPAFFHGEVAGTCCVFDLISGKTPIEEYVPKVGSVFQNPKTQYFNVDTTAELVFPCENTGMDAKEIQKRVVECAEEFSIQELLGRSIFKLSGGEKQRIAFASACMLNPKLLVLDEPTSNLDAQAIQQLHDMIARKKAEGVTIVIAEHRLAWIKDVADRFCFFENGRLAGDWSQTEFCHIPEPKLQEMGLRPLELSCYKKRITEKRVSISLCDTLPISASNLMLGYKKNAPVYTVDQFGIQSGEIVGLMGHNGVGKSTFVKTLCGLISPLQGTIQPSKKKMRIGKSFLVMQDVNYQLFSDSVREEVLLGARMPERCDAVLDAMGLLEFAERHPMSLSGGLKQRVVIASAILSGKEFLVLDEPTSGLDHYHMTQVARLIHSLKERGTAILVITHDEELAACWCDRIIDLQDKEKTNGISSTGMAGKLGQF